MRRFLALLALLAWLVGQAAGAPTVTTVAPPEVVVTCPPQTTTSATMEVVAGCGFTAAANTKYNFVFTITYQSSSTSGGIAFDLIGPNPVVTASYVSSPIYNSSSPTDVKEVRWAASSTLLAGDPWATSTGVPFANTDLTVSLSGYLETGASGGNVQLRFASVNGSATVSIRAGTKVSYQQVL